MSKTEQWLNSHRQSRDLKLREQYLSKFISILSGKGGVGKTTMCLKLAQALADIGHKVLVIDGDTNLSNTSVKLGLKLDDNFYDLLCSRKSFYECLKHIHGFDILPSCNGNIDLFKNKLKIIDILRELIVEHRAEYDFVILDCPAGMATETLELSAYSDIRILVSNPDTSSLTDTYSVIKVLKNVYHIDINHLLVNKVRDRYSYIKIVKTISETAEKFLSCRTNILGSVNFQENFDNFFSAKQWIGKEVPIHQCIVKIVDRLVDELTKDSFGKLELIQDQSIFLKERAWHLSQKN